ncbi:MAG: NAD(P)/FAD-dependent oxidoreductase [Planctomycetota bacterium]
MKPVTPQSSGPDSRADVIVIGAGASGLVCAAEAGRRGRSVRVLEHTGAIGNKIRISGGGRCNFTNRNVGPANYLSRNPHFCTSALARFTSQDFMALAARHGIAGHEEKHGQLFCNQGSRHIIRLLETECRAAGVRIHINARISAVERRDRFMIRTNLGDFQSDSLVVATGGLSFPKLGATALGHDLARQFGLHVVPCKPALVPLTWNRRDLATFGTLAGISLDAIVQCGAHEFHDDVLFTHKGLSGPAILQVSSYWEKGTPIVVDALPGRELMPGLTDMRNRHLALPTLLSRDLPKRFVKAWAPGMMPPKPIHQCSDKDLRTLAARLHRWEIAPVGTQGYDMAEATAGGVDTAEISSKTMEAHKAPGLYFVGEVLDVTGQLGGFNLQWAWSSGFAAGQYA